MKRVKETFKRATKRGRISNDDQKNCRKEEKKLKFACDTAVTKETNVLIADEGDQKIKTFDLQKRYFMRSFSSLDEKDVCGVTTEREYKLLVIIKLDKYRHESMYLINAVT